MAANAVDIVVSVVDKASQELNSIAEKLGGFDDIAKKVGTAFTAVGASITALSGVAINSASNLNESINAVNVVFGDAAQKIHEFGEVAAESAGLSHRAFNEAVTPIGSMLLNMGLSADEAANQSINLAQRAADMASVFNTDLGSAITAIQAGLRGEADPLERFGVGLNETAVKAHAVELGLIGSSEEMDAQTKIMARLSLFYDQTNRVAGDFENTSDGLANRMRILKAEFENISARVGEVLLPYVEQLVNAISPLIDKVIAWVEENPKLFATIVAVTAAIGGLLLVLGPILIAVGSLATLAGVLGIGLLPLIGIILAIGAAIAGLVALTVLVITNWESIVERASAIWESIKAAVVTKVTELRDSALAMWQSFSDGVTNIWNGIIGFLESVWNTIKDIVAFGVAFVVGLIIVAFDAMGIDVIAIWDEIKNWIGETWNTISTIITAGLELLSSIWNTTWTAISTFFTNIWTGISGSVKTKTGEVSGTVSGFIESVGAAWNGFWGGASNVVNTMWESVKGIVKSGINYVLEKINAAINAVNSVVAKGAGALGIKAVTIPTIPLLAKGGDIIGAGRAIVGEAGAEVVDLPRGARVTPLEKMQGGGITVVINNPQVWSDEDVVEKIGNPLIQVLKQHAAIA